jgi:hypothetical protein
VGCEAGVGVTDAERWLEKIYTWTGSQDDLIDEVFRRMEEHVVDIDGMHAGLPAVDADEVISKLDLTRVSITIMYGFLTITHGSFAMGAGKVGTLRHNLPSWPAFYDRVEARFKELEPERWKRLMPCWDRNGD